MFLIPILAIVVGIAALSIMAYYTADLMGVFDKDDDDNYGDDYNDDDDNDDYDDDDEDEYDNEMRLRLVNPGAYHDDWLDIQLRELAIWSEAGRQEISTWREEILAA